MAGDEVEPLVDVDSLEGVGDLLALGPESLKEALDRLGLKTGGTGEGAGGAAWAMVGAGAGAVRRVWTIPCAQSSSGRSGCG